jgi:hypothetical protein
VRAFVATSYDAEAKEAAEQNAAADVRIPKKAAELDALAARTAGWTGPFLPGVDEVIPILNAVPLLADGLENAIGEAHEALLQVAEDVAARLVELPR